jgi:hypothetical protein
VQLAFARMRREPARSATPLALTANRPASADLGAISRSLAVFSTDETANVAFPAACERLHTTLLGHSGLAVLPSLTAWFGEGQYGHPQAKGCP